MKTSDIKIGEQYATWRGNGPDNKFRYAWGRAVIIPLALGVEEKTAGSGVRGSAKHILVLRSTLNSMPPEPPPTVTAEGYRAAYLKVNEKKDYYRRVTPKTGSEYWTFSFVLPQEVKQLWSEFEPEIVEYDKQRAESLAAQQSIRHTNEKAAHLIAVDAEVILGKRLDDWKIDIDKRQVTLTFEQYWKISNYRFIED